MDSQLQTRQIIARIGRGPGAHCIRLNAIRFEHNRATFSKPGDRLARRRKPCASTLQILNQVTITEVPYPLRGKAAIVPVDRKAASKLDRIIHQSAEECRCLSW